MKENHAKGGTIVVMDARTGDVYAMASYPWFDPNDFERANREAVRNRAVTDMFEPGSVNKVVTAAAALESGAVGVRRGLPGAVVDARRAGTRSTTRTRIPSRT